MRFHPRRGHDPGDLRYMFGDYVATGLVRLADVANLVSGQPRPYVDRQPGDRTGGFLDDDPLAVELRGGLLMDHAVGRALGKGDN